MLLKSKKQETIEYTKKLSTQPSYLCKDARILYINGNGALKVSNQTIQDPEDYQFYIHQITLNRLPLIYYSSPGYPTSQGWVATGEGLEKTNSKELNAISKYFNEDFTDLDTAIENMKPLYSLLKTGLYIIADTVCIPTDGNGNFFWNAPDSCAMNPATAFAEIDDITGGYRYVDGFPAYIYPTQTTDCYNSERVDFYCNRMKSGHTSPHAIAYHCQEFLSFLIDGHHKACAAALLGQYLPCIEIIPLTWISFDVSGKSKLPDQLKFGPYTIHADEIPKKYLANLSLCDCKNGNFPKDYQGKLNQRNWENAYLQSAAQYPTVYELGVLMLSENVDLSDRAIRKCFSDLHPEAYNELYYILVNMQFKKDIRLKSLALACANITEQNFLKLKAFHILKEMKNDQDIENFFINWIIDDEDPHSLYAKIACSYWDDLM